MWDAFDNIMKHFEKLMDDAGRLVDNATQDSKSPSSSQKSSRFPFNYTYATKTVRSYGSQSAEKCLKCGHNAVTKRHVKVDEVRDCILISCSCCSFATTERTKDNPGRFDLPTVEEARKVQ